MWCLCGGGIDHDERRATLQQRVGNKGTYVQHGRERYRVPGPNVSTATHGVRADSQGASSQEQPCLDAANARGAPDPSLMTVEQLAQATQEFASTCVIGRGGFGTVYRGMIDLKPVAIKVMDDAGMQGVDEYRNELTVLARLDHPNIVRLVGFTAPDAQKLCLVSELMAHGSLEDRLLGRKPGMKRLPWSIRLQCASELATALAYLHSQQPPLCHRDIKPANVFLDSNQHAKLGDVGLARFLGPRPPAEAAKQPAGEAGEEEVLVGDYHYLPPEYKRTGQVSLEMDVYAFGVTLLQILSGREPLGLVKQVRNAVNDYRLQSVMDPHGGPGLDERLALRLAKLALWCCNSKPADRPSMSVIALQLESSLQSIRI